MKQKHREDNVSDYIAMRIYRAGTWIYEIRTEIAQLSISVSGKAAMKVGSNGKKLR